MFIYNSLFNKISDIHAHFFIIEMHTPLFPEEKILRNKTSEIFPESDIKDQLDNNTNKLEKHDLLQYYCPEYSSNDVDELFNCRFTTSCLWKINGIVLPVDYKSQFMNIINHSRCTTDIDQTKVYEKNYIHFWKLYCIWKFCRR